VVLGDLIDELLILGAGSHDGQATGLHGRQAGDGGHCVCGVAVCVKDANVPWEGFPMVLSLLCMMEVVGALVLILVVTTHGCYS
jgi:hypothetical protein